LTESGVTTADGLPIAHDEGVGPAESTAGVSLQQFSILIGAGAFATTIAQLKLVGRLPIQTFLKTHYHFNATQIASFMAIAVFAWNLKPLAGILTDAFPIFGTRRRHYMLMGTGLAAISWILMGLVSQKYKMFLGAAVALNIFMVVASTVMGALMVEAGQRYNAAGRISSLRQTVQSVGSLINGVLGGFLAGIAFGWTAGVGAFLLLLLVPLTMVYLKERPVAQRNTRVLDNAWVQLKTIVKAGTLWSAAGLLFLFYMAPGFNTPLYFRQTDVLGFSTKYIGLIETVAGGFGIISAILYGFMCKKLNLRRLLSIGVAASALWTLVYLFYGKTTAMAIDAGSMFVGVIAEVAIMDLAVRSTPKGCEALGFALMMSVRNLAISLNDILGSWLTDHRHWEFNKLVIVNAATTALALVLIPLLPKVIMSRREGEAK
jgi:MFS family permease